MSMESEFLSLERQITECRQCPRLVEWRERVAREKVRRFRNEKYWGRPLPAFGSIDSEVIIVGLAPAAHGGNRTGRMFTGDRSGDWLFDALHRYGFADQAVSVGINDGLQLQNCLITAVVRCAPPGNKPLPAEIGNCREYLVREFRWAARKRIVITLGQVAFRSCLKIWKELYRLSSTTGFEFCHGGEWDMNGVVLLSSYHPSQQNTLTGKLTRPMFYAIFNRAREILSEMEKLSPRGKERQILHLHNDRR
jgi:uracil-DNA glycosylase family 4